MEGVSVTRLGGVYFGARVCDTIVRGDLLVENVFYDPLRLDGEKPLCDESAGISPQDSNSKQQCPPSNYLPKMRRILTDTGCKYMKKLPNKGVEILNCGRRRNSQLGEKLAV